MKALPWLIALAFLALILIQEDRVNEYREERDEVQAEFNEGARMFWDNQAEFFVIHQGYLYELNYERLKNKQAEAVIKSQKLIIEAYEAEMGHYRKYAPVGAIPE